MFRFARPVNNPYRLYLGFQFFMAMGWSLRRRSRW